MCFYDACIAMLLLPRDLFHESKAHMCCNDPSTIESYAVLDSRWLHLVFCLHGRETFFHSEVVPTFFSQNTDLNLLLLLPGIWLISMFGQNRIVFLQKNYEQSIWPLYSCEQSRKMRSPLSTVNFFKAFSTKKKLFLSFPNPSLLVRGKRRSLSSPVLLMEEPILSHFSFHAHNVILFSSSQLPRD